MLFANYKKNGPDLYNIITREQPQSVAAEQYRKLRTSIEYSTFNDDLQVINITSAFGGEGKTVTVLNLATVYAQSGLKTLLIDMDLRKPKIHRDFDLPNKDGLKELVVDEKKPEDCIQSIDEHLDVLMAGEKLPFPAEFLMSQKLSYMIKTLRKTYDKIIIDTPPMTAVTDASIIGRIVDGVLIVFQSGVTKTDGAKEIVSTLKDNGANILGGVLTRVSPKDNRYMNYYYADQD